MNVWYLDSSALVKHHVEETGSSWISATLFEPLDNLLLSSRVTMIEVRSALARRKREASISLQNHADALAVAQSEGLRTDNPNRHP
jgi:predicted nucleic acid-binding protein